jgi:hypothetical protein
VVRGRGFDPAKVDSVGSEVDEQSDGSACGAGVGPDLRVVCLAECFDGLQLDDNPTLDENVEPVPPDLAPVVPDDKLLLDLGRQPLPLEFEKQFPPIHTLQKPRPQHLVHPYDAEDDPLRELPLLPD